MINACPYTPWGGLEPPKVDVLKDGEGVNKPGPSYCTAQLNCSYIYGHICIWVLDGGGVFVKLAGVFLGAEFWKNVVL